MGHRAVKNLAFILFVVLFPALVVGLWITLFPLAASNLFPSYQHTDHTLFVFVMMFLTLCFFAAGYFLLTRAVVNLLGHIHTFQHIFLLISFVALCFMYWLNRGIILQLSF